MHIFDRCTTSGFCLCHGDCLDLDVRCGLVKMDIEADNILCSPTVTCPVVGVHSPIFDALFQYDVGISSLQGKVHVLFTKCKTCQHMMVTTDDDSDGAVWTVVGVTHRIVLVLVGHETKIVKTLLQTLMKWHGIGTKGNNLALVVYLKVEMLA